MAWFLQLVHYPLYTMIDRLEQYIEAHLGLIIVVAAPFMTLELITAFFIFQPVTIWYVHFALLVAIWCASAALGVAHVNTAPVHTIMRLHWLRTASWTARLVLLLL